MATDARTYLATMVLNEERAVSYFSIGMSLVLTRHIGYLSRTEPCPKDTP